MPMDGASWTKVHFDMGHVNALSDAVVLLRAIYGPTIAQI